MFQTDTDCKVATNTNRSVLFYAFVNSKYILHVLYENLRLKILSILCMWNWNRYQHYISIRNINISNDIFIWNYFCHCCFNLLITLFTYLVFLLSWTIVARHFMYICNFNGHKSPYVHFSPPMPVIGSVLRVPRFSVTLNRGHSWRGHFRSLFSMSGQCFSPYFASSV